MVFVKNYFSIGDDGWMPHDEIVVTRCLGNAAEGKACADADMTGPEDSFVFKHDSAHTTLRIQTNPEFCNVVAVFVGVAG